MKNLLLFFALIFSITVFSQKGTVAIDEDMFYDKTESYFTGSTTDRVGYSGDATWTYTIKKWCKSPIYNVSVVYLSRPSVGGSITVVLNQKTTALDTYTAVETVIWHKTTADTIIKLNNSGIAYVTFNQVSITGSTATATAKIERIENKVFEQ